MEVGECNVNLRTRGSGAPVIRRGKARCQFVRKQKGRLVMDKRYANPAIAEIWSDKNKKQLWQRSELAVLEAKANLKMLDRAIFEAIRDILNVHLIDLEFCDAREKETDHDLEAFLDERRRFLKPEVVRKMIEGGLLQDLTQAQISQLEPELHKKMTSYDTEEPAFNTMLIQSYETCRELVPALLDSLKFLALKYRYTPMLADTHGQPAEIQSFGKMCLACRADVEDAWEMVRMLSYVIYRSKMSGMIGNYGGLGPEVEAQALKIMGLKPYYGATQIMPRGPYSMFAHALANVVLVISKVALDIRLGARGGLAKAIYQEPFGTKQKGSSRKPDKKNTIKTEKLEGMARMAKGYADMARDNVVTWRERAIEQSCVERNCWPDLFHVFCHSVETITKVLQKLAVYPDHMMQEIVDSRGCYASGEAKEFIRDHFAVRGLSVEDAYRAVQLASFKVFVASPHAEAIRKCPSHSFSDADIAVKVLNTASESDLCSITEILKRGELESIPGLDVSEEQVAHLNEALREMFNNLGVSQKFDEIFKPSYWMRNEAILYRQILGV